MKELFIKAVKIRYYPIHSIIATYYEYLEEDEIYLLQNIQEFTFPDREGIIKRILKRIEISMKIEKEFKDMEIEGKIEEIEGEIDE